MKNNITFKFILFVFFALFTCGVSAQTVSGSDILCLTGTETYTVSNASGVNIAWNCSPNLQIVSGNTGTSCSIRALSSGSGTVSVTLTGTGGATTKTKTVWVGTPSVGSIQLLGVMTPADNTIARNTYQVINAGLRNYSGVTEIEWSFGSWANYFVGYNNDYVGNDYKQGSAGFRLDNSAASSSHISVRARNKCGYASGAGGSLAMTFYAISYYSLNVATRSGDVKLAIVDELGVSQPGDDESWSMEVYDLNNNLVERKNNIRGGEYSLSTTTWKKGMHIFVVKYKDQVLTQKAIIR